MHPKTVAEAESPPALIAGRSPLKEQLVEIGRYISQGIVETLSLLPIVRRVTNRKRSGLQTPTARALTMLFNFKNF
jgi:hypothetical protein